MGLKQGLQAPKYLAALAAIAYGIFFSRLFLLLFRENFKYFLVALIGAYISNACKP